MKIEKRQNHIRYNTNEIKASHPYNDVIIQINNNNGVIKHRVSISTGLGLMKLFDQASMSFALKIFKIKYSSSQEPNKGSS